MTAAPRLPAGRLRRLLAVAVATVSLVALSACAAIPVDGGVRTGQAVKDQAPSGVDYRPNGPEDGADQQTILRAFIDAGTGAQDNYAVAREFLSDRFAQKWNPRRGVTVLQGVGDVERSESDELTYTLTARATVDADGSYTQSVRPTSSTLTFQFTRQGGQWRISYAPDGIILTPVQFGLVFQAHALFFYDPTYRYLVPDERWFLARSSTSTRIASALLAGPVDWLKGAVVSSFPEGTRLSLNAVTISSGAAQVDLSSDALKATTLDKVRMREQLSASLSSVATISAVDMTIEGTEVAVPDSSGTSAQRDPDVDPRPLVVDDGTVGYATSDGNRSGLGEIGDAVAALDPDALALSASGAEAVVRDRDGVFVVRNGKSLRLDPRTDLVAPSIDDQGHVWSAEATDPSSITAYGFGGDPHVLRSTLPEGDLVTFQVSRDSTRALALIDAADGPALYVMAILRDSSRVPTAFGPPIRVQAASGDPVGATWVSDLEVASVGQTASGASVVTTVVGGQSTVLPRPDGRVTTVVGGLGGTLLLRTSDGSVLQQTGGAWDSTNIDADVLGVQR